MPAPPLHLTDDLDLDLSDPHSVDVRYPGDLRLATTFGRQIGAVHVGGDLDLELPVVSGTCLAQGALRTVGDVDANRLTARELHLGGGTIRARALSATEKIVIGPARLKVDVIIAPVIEIDPNASGRVTVIESRNERGTNKVKGGFSLAEYDELFGDAVDFLAARGVAPLDHMGDPLADIDVLEVEDLEEVEPEPLDDLPEVEPEPLDDDAMVEIEPEPLDDDAAEAVVLLDESDLMPVEVEPVDEDAFAEDLLSDGLEDEDAGIIQEVQRAALPPRAPTPEPPQPRDTAPLPTSPALDAWFAKVDEVVASIRGDYSEAPAPLDELVSLVDTRRPDALTHGLVPVWQEVVRHHLHTRAPLAPRVSHGFRVLHDLVTMGPPQ